MFFSVTVMVTGSPAWTLAGTVPLRVSVRGRLDHVDVALDVLAGGRDRIAEGVRAVAVGLPA